MQVRARRWRTRTAAGTAALAILAVAGGITLVVVANHKPQPAYANVSRNFRACLFSTTRDRTVALPTWQAITSAKVHATVNAQQTIAPPGSTAELVQYLRGVVNLKCGLVITSGSDLHNALVVVAKENPEQRFLNVGAPSGLANIKDFPMVPIPEDQIRDAVIKAAHGSA